MFLVRVASCLVVPPLVVFTTRVRLCYEKHHAWLLHATSLLFEALPVLASSLPTVYVAHTRAGHGTKIIIPGCCVRPHSFFCSLHEPCGGCERKVMLSGCRNSSCSPSAALAWLGREEHSAWWSWIEPAYVFCYVQSVVLTALAR